MMRSTTTLRCIIQLSITSFCLALAEDNCGPFGNNDDSKLTPVRSQTFYLNTANPAPCTGNITSWKICYYGPDTLRPQAYWATFAVYRKTGSGSFEHYERVSEVLHAIRALPLISILETAGHVDGTIQANGFMCYKKSVDTNTPPITVQAGDVLGACVFDPEDNIVFLIRRQLDIVGQTSGESLLGMDTSECTIDVLPTTITASQLTTYPSRRLHLHANIAPFEEEAPPGTNTVAVPTSEISKASTSSATTHVIHTMTLIPNYGSSTTVSVMSPISGLLTTEDTVTTTNISVTAQSDQRAGIISYTVGAIVGSLLFMALLIILVVAVFMMVYSKYKKVSPDEERSTEDNEYYNMYSYPNHHTVSDLRAGYDSMDGSTVESRREATVTEQNTAHQQSEISLFPNIAYTKKPANSATAIESDVMYDSIKKGTPASLSHDKDIEELAINYAYNFPDPLTVLDFQEECTFQSGGEVTIKEQNAAYERSEILLFRNVAYPKKGTNTATATESECVVYDTIATAKEAAHGVHNPLQDFIMDSDNEYDYV